jgi:putative FmdB family regulatory protein
VPIYEYACCACHQEFELLVRGQQQPECPKCGSQELEKLLSVPAAHTSSRSSLPVCAPPPGGGCGLPQCGGGQCGMGFDA